jgi:sugar phosphate isomerase/epimerase
VGLVLDVWHWERQPDGPDLEALAEVPADRIVGLQLDDVSPESDGDLLEETMASRRPPGEGVADIAGLLAVLEGARADPLVSLEVFNHALLIAEGPAGLARRVADGARRALGPL